jgi:hypothetical protein
METGKHQYRVGFFFSLGHSTIVVIASLIVFASASKASTGRNLQAVAKITISFRYGAAVVHSAPLKQLKLPRRRRPLPGSSTVSIRCIGIARAAISTSRRRPNSSYLPSQGGRQLKKTQSPAEYLSLP